jgi:predicted nucleotidyltransferase
VLPAADPDLIWVDGAVIIAAMTKSGRLVPSLDGLDEVRAAEPLALRWSVLLAWRGSVAHGTYRPNTEPNSIDDKDLMGVVVPGVEWIAGLRQFGSAGTLEVQRDPWDIVIYDYRKALRLLAKGNPNVLCLLWLPEDMYIELKPAGQMLRAERELFATKSSFDPFRGYANSQLEKMQRGAHLGYMGEKRRRLVEKHGYDTKNASHLIRILRQGIEFLKTGSLQVIRPDAEELLAIKNGAWSLEEVRREAERLDRDLEAASHQSSLPDAPDFDAINKLAVAMAEASEREL